MARKKNNLMLWIALVWIVISVLSMFASVVSYSENGKTTVYAMQDMIDGQRFSKEVLSKYTGEFVIHIGSWAVTLLCIVSICAIVSSIVGILLLSKQRPVTWPFIMTVAGMIGTSIPALLILIATILSAFDFPGTIIPGFYPIITPIAIAFCLFVVVKERKRVKKATAQMKASAYIAPAGDL